VQGTSWASLMGGKSRYAKSCLVAAGSDATRVGKEESASAGAGLELDFERDLRLPALVPTEQKFKTVGVRDFPFYRTPRLYADCTGRMEHGLSAWVLFWC
jgi:hypothetical protein